RIGQRIAWRFSSELRCLVFLAVEHAAPHAVLEAELRRHDLAAEAAGRRLVTVVGTRLFFLRLSTGRQLIRTQRILFALSFVADVAALLRGGLRLASLDVGVFRPGWIVGNGCTWLLRRRQRTAGRKDERRTLLVIDVLLAVAAEAEPFHDVAQEFLIGREGIISRLREGGGGTNERSCAEDQAKSGAGAKDARHAHRAHPNPDHGTPRIVATLAADQGAFAARSITRESYNRPITPATMATSARLKTYQSKRQFAVEMWKKTKSATHPEARRSMDLHIEPPMIRPRESAVSLSCARASQTTSNRTATVLKPSSIHWPSAPWVWKSP